MMHSQPSAKKAGSMCRDGTMDFKHMPLAENAEIRLLPPTGPPSAQARTKRRWILSTAHRWLYRY
jgi:hypothetical protein